MQELGVRNPALGLTAMGINTNGTVRYNFAAEALYEEALGRGEAVKTAHGTLRALTGQHTGRSPKDKFVVRDENTENAIWWDNNKAVSREHFDALHADMLAHGLDRHCCVIALGGGAVLDAVGYACATFHRGMRLIRLPSTVLAQNDAGIGVKNGINAFGQKNLLGAFYPATAVINDFQLLTTLGHRDQIAGLAEAVKVALIKDRSFFEWMERQADALARFDHPASRHAIRRCAELHLGHITGAGDPFERGNGRPLDYGHWAAHRLENLSQHRLRHGEAVAVGMALDGLYANALGLLNDIDSERILSLLLRLGFNLCPAELNLKDDQGRSRVLLGLEEFRQHLGGQLSIPMLSGIGASVDLHEIDDGLMEQALLRLASYRGNLLALGEGCAQ